MSIIKGSDTQEMALTSALFQNMSEALYWRVDFRIRKVSSTHPNSSSTGLASLYLVVNLLPKNGQCFVNNYTGMSLHTWFKIECVNWVDSDGFVANFQFFGKNNNGF